MKRLKTVGLNAEPWGTPALMLVSSLIVFPTLTTNFLFSRKEGNHLFNGLAMALHLLILYWRPLYQTALKAPSKSMKAAMKISFLALATCANCESLNVWSLVEWPALKALWQLGIAPFFCRLLASLVANMVSNSLPITERSETGLYPPGDERYFPCLGRGTTMATFQRLGTYPKPSDML